MGILGFAFQAAASNILAKAHYLDNPFEAFIGHISNVGNVTTAAPKPNGL